MSRNPIVVATFDNSLKAQIAANHLRGAGITAVVLDSGLADTLWTMHNAIGWVKVSVPEDQADKALQLLEQIENWPGDSGEPPEADAATEDEPDAADLSTHKAAGYDRHYGEDAADDGTDDSSPDTSPSELSEREQAAERAFRAAVFGTLLPFLQPFATLMLVEVWIWPEPLRGRSRRLAIIATLINGVYVAAAVVFVLALLGVLNR
jgi:hypothetical protein